LSRGGRKNCLTGCPPARWQLLLSSSSPHEKLFFFAGKSALIRVARKFLFRGANSHILAGWKTYLGKSAPGSSPKEDENSQFAKPICRGKKTTHQFGKGHYLLLPKWGGRKVPSSFGGEGVLFSVEKVRALPPLSFASHLSLRSGRKRLARVSLLPGPCSPTGTHFPPPSYQNSVGRGDVSFCLLHSCTEKKGTAYGEGENRPGRWTCTGKEGRAG